MAFKHFLKSIITLFQSKTILNKSYKSFQFNTNSTKNLLCSIGESVIQEDTIVIANYPFEPAIAYPEKSIHASCIDAICVDFGILKVMVENDIVFIASDKKEALQQFAAKNHIELIPYNWVWDFILEPYLDTEFTEEHEKTTSKRLDELGFDKIQVAKIRNEVGTQMMKYNFETMLWDWCSLGIFDVLSAMRAKYNQEEFSVFYKNAIAIEKHGLPSRRSTH